MFRFAGRPALDIEVIRFKDQFPITQGVNVFDNLAAVDLPKERDFLTLEETNVHGIDLYFFNTSPAVLMRISKPLYKLSTIFLTLTVNTMAAMSETRYSAP